MKMVATLAFFQIIMLYGLLYTSMTLVPGALAAIIIGSSPLNSAIVAHFFMSGDKMSGKKSASLILGIAGVCIISLSRQPWNSFHGLKEFLGILLLLGASFSSAFGNVIVARQKHGIHPVLLNSAQIFFGGFVLFLISLPIEGPPKLVREPEFYMALAWLSFVSATAFSLWFMLLKRPGVKVSELNLWKFVVPVSGAALSWFLLPEESPRALTILGMILIAFSIILYNLSTILRKQEKNIKVIQPAKAKTVDHRL
jgi:drug/metabolite transporter (DMT)-like permease